MKIPRIVMDHLWNFLPQKKNVSTFRGGSQTPRKHAWKMSPPGVLLWNLLQDLSCTIYPIYLSIYLSIYLLSAYLSIDLSTDLSIYRSIHLLYVVRTCSPGPKKLSSGAGSQFSGSFLSISTSCHCNEGKNSWLDTIDGGWTVWNGIKSKQKTSYRILPNKLQHVHKDINIEMLQIVRVTHSYDIHICPGVCFASYLCTILSDTLSDSSSLSWRAGSEASSATSWEGFKIIETYWKYTFLGGSEWYETHGLWYLMIVMIFRQRAFISYTSENTTDNHKHSYTIDETCCLKKM